MIRRKTTATLHLGQRLDPTPGQSVKEADADPAQNGADRSETGAEICA